MPRPTEISTYNPHLIPREDLVAAFIARRALLDELVDDLRRGAHQHHLLVGVRGAGKTTLLLRLAVAIEEDKKLARTTLPLRFAEEQYNVAHPSDFWLNCLDALLDVLDARGDHAAKRKLEAEVAAIMPLTEKERGIQAIATLIAWARLAKKTLVLLVDNFDLILERLKDAQWAMREALSHDNGIVLIGATSRFLDATITYGSPLYDFFHVHELGPVTEEEARDVVLHLAKLRGHQQVQAVLERDPGRFKALYVLTGGMPRMLVLLSSVLARENPSVEADLERMLDQLTPYYKARFDELPAQSQRIVDAVALHWHPITAAACAEQTRFDVKIVSAQLNRLVQQGTLTKIALPGTSKLGFLLTERFFNIWYLMRANRRVRQKLAWFVEFLRTWYGEEELARRAQVLLDATPGANDPARMLALATTLSDAALRRRLESRAVTMLLEQSPLEEMRELLDLEGADAHLVPVLDRAKALKQLHSHVASHSKLARLGEAIIGSPIIPLASKIGVLEALLHKRTDIISAAVIRQLVASHKERREEFGVPLLTAIASGEVPSFPDVTTRADVVALLGLAKSSVDAAGAILTSGRFYKNPAFGEIFRYIVEQGPRLVALGFAFAMSELDKGEWLAARHQAYELLRSSVPGWGTSEWLGLVAILLQHYVQLGRTQEAASLLAEADPDERWLSIHEALKAAAAGNPDLSHLAPEVRALTTELLAFFRSEDASETADRTAPAQRTRHSQPQLRSQPAQRASGDRGAARQRTSRRRGRAATAGTRRAPARRR
ncbi:MAG TPA: ATP-binding protein [Kofleriaceae bacterium]|nr:ATP-binding protein [Kofleriaceae bacterium]